MRRQATVFSLSALAVLATAGAAWGHASLDQASVPKDSDQALTLRVPVEPKGHGAGGSDLAQRHNARVVVVIPDGFAARGCDPKPGWTCAVNPAGPKNPLNITWAREGGPVDRIDVFGFTVHSAGTPGPYRFNTIQGYSDGDKEFWDDSPGKPAPALEVQ